MELKQPLITSFLVSCPKSMAVQFGHYIRKPILLMDEDPKFLRDGKDGQELRKDDFVDVDEMSDCDRVLRRGSRTRLMRKCWRSILNMPKLRWIKFNITPAQGKVDRDQIQCWEVRDLLPTYFRLWAKGVDVHISLRTWRVYKEPTSSVHKWLYRWGKEHLGEDGRLEGQVHLDHYTEGCLEPSEEDRNEAAAILARKEQWTIPTPGGEGPDCTKYHQVRTHDALDEFTNRLQADAGN